MSDIINVGDLEMGEEYSWDQLVECYVPIYDADGAEPEYIRVVAPLTSFTRPETEE